MRAKPKDKDYEKLKKLIIEEQQTKKRITELDDQIKELKKERRSM